MIFPYQLLVMTDKTNHIQEIQGEEEKVFHSDQKILHLGQSFVAVDWQRVFTEPLAMEQFYQTLQTVRGEKVFFCRYPLEEYKRNAFVFTNLTPWREDAEGTSLVFESPAMQHILKIINNISEVDSTVLLLGESGVGKSEIAKVIHEKSKRSAGPFLTVNCGALPESLMESELFGYESGAFTGGKSGGKQGLFEAADGGTIFLDEIAELPYAMQSKLLDVIQESRVRKVGGLSEKEIDVRVMAATNKDLSALVQENKFREDLYYRLNVVPLHIPPLRERKEDIPALIHQLVASFNQKYGRSLALTDGMIDEMVERRWTGNIRELANTIERMVVTNEVDEAPVGRPAMLHEESEEETFPTLKEARENAEKELILKVYGRYHNTYTTAQVLGVDQSTISKKMKKYKDNT